MHQQLPEATVKYQDKNCFIGLDRNQKPAVAKDDAVFESLQ
jgi:hypothetical protein